MCIRDSKKIKLNFGLSGVYFMEIAKFRAARMMWAQIVKQYNPVCPREDCTNTGEDKSCNCACKMYVNATTSTYNMTVFDSYVNMLRTQTEACLLYTSQQLRPVQYHGVILLPRTRQEARHVYQSHQRDIRCV